MAVNSKVNSHFYSLHRDQQDAINNVIEVMYKNNSGKFAPNELEVLNNEQNRCSGDTEVSNI